MDHQEENTFTKYGKTFQEKLVQQILVDRVFADKMREVLDTNHLELKYLQIFTSKLFKYRDEFDSHPSLETFSSIINTISLDETTESVKEQIVEFLDKITKGKIDTSDDKWVQKEALGFCKKQKVQEAMILATKKLKSASYEEIEKIILHSVKLGTEEETGHDIKVDFEALFAKQYRSTIPTGWSQVNDITFGGLGKGNVGVVVARSGLGKSWLLCHLGVSAWMKGYNVVHYTLEMDSTEVFRRYVAIASGIPLSELDRNRAKIQEIVNQHQAKLLFKRYPAKSISLPQIRRDLDRMKKNKWKPDVVIIDYDELLAIPNKGERHVEYGELYTEMTGVASEIDAAFWVAAQTNRTGVSAEIVDLDNLASSYAKVMPCHFICTLSRSQEDKAQNMAKLYIAKNRNGPDGMVFKLFMDTSCGEIKILEETTPEAVSSNAVEEQEKRLKEKYKEFMAEQKKGGK